MTSYNHLQVSFTPTREMNSKNIHPLMFSSSKSTHTPFLKFFILSDINSKYTCDSQIIYTLSH